MIDALSPVRTFGHVAKQDNELQPFPPPHARLSPRGHIADLSTSPSSSGSNTVQQAAGLTAPSPGRGAAKQPGPSLSSQMRWQSMGMLSPTPKGKTPGTPGTSSKLPSVAAAPMSSTSEVGSASMNPLLAGHQPPVNNPAAVAAWEALNSNTGPAVQKVAPPRPLLRTATGLEKYRQNAAVLDPKLNRTAQPQGARKGELTTILCVFAALPYLCCSYL